MIPNEYYKNAPVFIKDLVLSLERKEKIIYKREKRGAENSIFDSKKKISILSKTPEEYEIYLTKIYNL